MIIKYIDWLSKGEIKSLVLVIIGLHTGETLERWVFNIETDKDILSNKIKGYEKSEQDIMKEIQAIIRQITASVTFLPLIEEPCSFELLVYTDKNTEIPIKWEESDPKYINNSTEVRLRSFTTKVHKIDTLVSYKNNDFNM